VYGHTTSAGLVYTDITANMVYKLTPSLSAFDTVFSAPAPPRGTSYIYPVGIAFDGIYYWVVNSSNTSDNLFKVSYKGKVETRIDLPYEEPGTLVYSTVDVRIPPTPIVTAVAPSVGVVGRTNIAVDVYGNEFVNRPGLAVSFGEGVTVDSLQFVSSTQLHLKISIVVGATPGKRDIRVTNPGGRFATLVQKFEVDLITPVTHLWLTESDMDSLYSIRIADSTTILKKWNTHNIAAGQNPQGLAFDGTNIWLCAAGSDKKIYKLNTSDTVLSAISSIPGPTSAGTLRGIAWYDSSLWVTVSGLSGNSGKIYRVNPSTGAVQDSVNTPGIEPRAVVFANGIMYTNDATLDSLYIYDGAAWKSVFQTPIPSTVPVTSANRLATGLAWDGTNFWIANSNGNYDYIMQVNTIGILLQSFPSPRIGPAVISGIVVTPN